MAVVAPHREVAEMREPVILTHTIVERYWLSHTHTHTHTHTKVLRCAAKIFLFFLGG